MDNKERFQRGCFVTLIVVMILIGFIGAAGSLNYAHGNGNVLYTIGGIGCLADSICAGIAIYRKYLKSPKLK